MYGRDTAVWSTEIDTKQERQHPRMKSFKNFSYSKRKIYFFFKRKINSFT